jgi:hypothetical protein
MIDPSAHDNPFSDRFTKLFAGFESWRRNAVTYSCPLSFAKRFLVGDRKLLVGDRTVGAWFFYVHSARAGQMDSALAKSP